MSNLLKEILSNDWLISDDRKSAYASMLLSLFRGEPVTEGDLSESRAKNRAYVVKTSSLAGDGQRLSLHDQAIPEGSIAVIPIRGEIFKYDQECGPRGTLSIIQDIQAAEYNPKIKSILFVIDSPGGMVSYTDILADAVKNIQKPKIAYVEGGAFSGAYWIASAADRIIASSDLDRVGSIGTMLFFADLQPYYEEMGIKYHEIYATKSVDKNKEYRELTEGKYDNYRKDVLDRINEKFHKVIRENRPGVDESVLTGKVYFAPDAITLGLIDEINTMDYTLGLLDGKTEEQTTPPIPKEVPQTEENMKIKFKAAWTAIMSVFGMVPEEAAEKEQEITPEMLEQLNDKLANIQTKNADLEKNFQDERAAKLQLEEDLTTAKSTLAQVQTELSDLKQKDAGGETRAKKDIDKSESVKTEDELSHNKAADKFLGK